MIIYYLVENFPINCKLEFLNQLTFPMVTFICIAENKKAFFNQMFQRVKDRHSIMLITYFFISHNLFLLTHFVTIITDIFSEQNSSKFTQPKPPITVLFHILNVRLFVFIINFYIKESNVTILQEIRSDIL